MLLRTRNRILIFCFIFSLLFVVTIAILFFSAYSANQIVVPTVSRQNGIFSTFFFKYKFSAVITSIAAISLYVPVTFLCLYLNFEKTQSSEVIFFVTFLLGCLTESIRAVNTIYDFRLSFSTSLIIINKFVFFGRMLCPLSMLCSTVMSESEQRQDLERNFIIMLAAAAFFAFTIPIDSANFTATCLVPWGFSGLFNVVYILLAAAALVSFYIEAKIHESPERIKMLVGFILLITGYYLLILFGNLFSFIVGICLLSAGTYIYLKNVHQLYLWN